MKFSPSLVVIVKIYRVVFIMSQDGLKLLCRSDIKQDYVFFKCVNLAYPYT